MRLRWTVAVKKIIKFPIYVEMCLFVAQNTSNPSHVNNPIECLWFLTYFFKYQIAICWQTIGVVFFFWTSAVRQMLPHQYLVQ